MNSRWWERKGSSSCYPAIFKHIQLALTTQNKQENGNKTIVTQQLEFLDHCRNGALIPCIIYPDIGWRPRPATWASSFSYQCIPIASQQTPMFTDRSSTTSHFVFQTHWRSENHPHVQIRNSHHPMYQFTFPLDPQYLYEIGLFMAPHPKKIRLSRGWSSPLSPGDHNDVRWEVAPWARGWS